MSSHSIELYLLRHRDNKFKLVSEEPVYYDFMGLLERVVDDTFEYLSKLEPVDKRDLPDVLSKYPAYVDAHNFYYIPVHDFYKELGTIIDDYTEELKCLCKSLGFTRTTVESEDILLGTIKSSTTLSANADLVSECIRKRNRAMVAEYIQGMIKAWTYLDGGHNCHMDCFKFIAVYDY